MIKSRGLFFLATLIIFSRKYSNWIIDITRYCKMHYFQCVQDSSNIFKAFGSFVVHLQIFISNKSSVHERKIIYIAYTIIKVVVRCIFIFSTWVLFNYYIMISKSCHLYFPSRKFFWWTFMPRFVFNHSFISFPFFSCIPKILREKSWIGLLLQLVRATLYIYRILWRPW